MTNRLRDPKLNPSTCYLLATFTPLTVSDDARSAIDLFPLSCFSSDIRFFTMFDADDITGTKIQGPQDLFDIRGTLLQKTNPLRTKILIFSTIYRQFDFSDRDWLTLKTQELDSLLRHLFDACPTVLELEERLANAAKKLGTVEEYQPSVDVLVRVLSSFYRSSHDLNLHEQTANTDDRESVEESVEESVKTNRSLEEDSSIEDEEESDAEQSCVLWDESSPQIPSSWEDAEPEPESDRSYWRDFSPAPSPRLADRLLQDLATSDRVRELVRHQSRHLTDTIAQGIADLEGQLEGECASLDIEEQVHIKHDAVRDLLDDLRTNLDRMRRILDRQVSMHLLQITPSPTTDRDRTFKDKARQGSPEAIAEWLDRDLKHQGITVLATQKDRCLHIVLELSNTCDPAELSATVRQNILELNLKTIDRVEIHGRKPGKNAVEWTRIIDI